MTAVVNQKFIKLIKYTPKLNCVWAEQSSFWHY